MCKFFFLSKIWQFSAGSDVPSRKVKIDRSVKLTTHLHSVPRLRMSGGVPVLPVYDFRASQGNL